ncbi:MAG TPA: NADH:flavin oxidoreductase [Verrucomicrobiales bacterium]|nr:NADH:flavin oxidoreductase [Verrucomicrobiales bacterium]
MTSQLFTPVQIGNRKLSHRITVAPMCQYSSVDGSMSDWHLMHLGSLAISGASMLVMEATGVTPAGRITPYCPGLYSDANEAAMKRVADYVRSISPIVLGVQLAHAGRKASSHRPWQGHGPLQANEGAWQTLAPSAVPLADGWPAPHAMSKADMQQLTQAFVQATQRAARIGLDFIELHSTHGYLLSEFLSPLSNRRDDEYGGSLENRTRLIREMIEDTKDAVGGSCGVAVRLAVDELHGPGGITSHGEGRDALALLAELPDLWDVNVGGSLGNDSRSARFSEEGFQEEHVAFVKSLTSKPVVSVGRFTSPDRMVSQIRRGIQDFIGAARPSIADPFLPQKIMEGREDEIRECIGCNICRASNNEGIQIRCTQNPTMGEEWRKGWHPEIIPPRHARESVLVVGAGPAGLEATLALARRGYEVTLAEASEAAGGRLLHESRLPGLATWIRVRDHRLHMIGKLANASVFLNSPMAAQDVLDFGAPHVVLATGSHWRRDGIGVVGEIALSLDGALTPDDLYAGRPVSGPVVIYDDEHYAIASALAEKLRRQGHDVHLVTTLPVVSSWTAMTDEQSFIQSRLLGLDVAITPSHMLGGLRADVAQFDCAYTGRRKEVPCGTLVLVTGRLPNAALHQDMLPHAGALATLRAIGDCHAPGLIADAVYSGHRLARELGEDAASLVLRRERPAPRQSP